MAREVYEPEELREFAEAGEPPSEADPDFEARLRERLWKLLRRRLGLGREARRPLD